MRIRSAALVLFAAGTVLLAQDASALEVEIPEWVKNNAKWWHDGLITDDEFARSIEFMIDNKIINVKATKVGNEYFEEYESWAENEIARFQDHAEKLKNENARMKKEIIALEEEYLELERSYGSLEDAYDYLSSTYDESLSATEEYVKEVEEWFYEQSSKPVTTIYDQSIHWKMFDSKGNEYNWSMPVESYESYVLASRYGDNFVFETEAGSTFYVVDHTKYVGESFSQVIDEVYENAHGDEDFIFEVWFIASQLTTYSTEIGEYPRWALETLSRGGGDCEDTTILILDMIRSSKYTRDWTLQMVYFDSDNPADPNTINHVAPVIYIGEYYWIVESTAKSFEGMSQWDRVDINGWWMDV